MSNEKEPNFFDSGNLLTFVYNRWKPLLIIAILAMVASVIISFLLPEKYKATVVLFPTQNNNYARGFLSKQSDDTKDFLAFGEDNNAEQLLQVLKSDELMYALEKRYHLLKYYSLEDKWDKYYLFKGYYNDLFDYNTTQYESIEIKVYDQNPHMAAELANGAAHLADSLLQLILKQRAVVAYKIAKKQYDSALAVTNKLEDSLNFYHKLGILAWQYQVDELTAGYTDALVDNNAGAAKQIKNKLDTFQIYGSGFLTVSNELEATFEWFKTARESYMEAQADAEQTMPSFFVADKAVAPDRRTYPIRGLVVIGGTLAALFIALLMMLIANRLKTLKKK